MKIHEFTESHNDDKKLLAIARRAGEKLYGNDRSGLIFTDKLKRVSREEYDKLLGDAAGYVDTFDYVFYPSTGKGLDAADTKLSKRYVDVDGNIYLAGAHGVTIITDPFSKIKSSTTSSPEVQRELELFKRETLKHFPNAKFKPIDKFGRIFAYDDDKMCGQFLSTNEHSREHLGKPAWLVHNGSKKNW